jgi:Predicted transcriptional regulators
MDFGQKLKEIRKNEGLSQEQLAEKIGVSRQAITKWETGRGLPDIENMMILAEIFKTTLDELVSQDMPQSTPKTPVYHSETSFDIDRQTHFDMQIGAAHSLTVCTGEDEKLHIDLASESMENIGSLFKVKLDQNRGKLDVECIKKDGVSRYESADALSVIITLPKALTVHCEMAASVKELRMTNLTLDCLEYDGDAQSVTVTDCCGSIELTSRTSYDITVDGIRGSLDINQWKADSIVHIPGDADFSVRNKGRGCRVFYQRNGESTENGGREDSENILSLSGVHSELIVDLQ